MLGGRFAKNKAVNPQCPFPCPFGRVQVISGGMLFNSDALVGHAAHILLASVFLHVSSAQNGMTPIG